jgi:hypothetical protein
MKLGQQLVLGFFFIGFSFLLAGPYLFLAYQAYRKNTRLEPERLRRKIAEQEVALGLKPQMEGTCRVCQHPLQTGAQYCLHCGTSIAEQFKICPACATVTIMDAKWCPSCRTPLDI